ncbi:hypothetical protein CPC08DRAFT_702113 [Agrocybe pediades]|nr:hypothetical protein CPC08DRAFT_702113 [Agrocybe pediades]
MTVPPSNDAPPAVHDDGSHPIAGPASSQASAPHTVVPQPTNDASSQPGSASSTQATTSGQRDSRDELIAKARSFLSSPQVQYQDVATKRAFLAEKGLNAVEVEELLRTLPHQVPNIPPRTYPQPPPSNLPILLLGLARLFSWLAGGSAVLLFVYKYLLLPRVTQSTLARRSLKSHQLSLMRQLNASIATTKQSMSNAFSVLPRLDIYKEPEIYARCGSVPDIVNIIEAKKVDPEVDNSRIPHVTLLRCGIQDLVKSQENDNKCPTTETLFKYLESQIPWLLTDEGLQYESSLWDTLSTCPLFSQVSDSSVQESSDQSHADTPSTSISRWTYTAPPTPDAAPLLKSYQSLSSALPKGTKPGKGPLQHTLQAMSDFTGYISTQVYLPYRPPPSGLGVSTAAGANSVEEDLRKEIRALKGLVLNRRSFLPSVSRNQTPPARTTP